jgi:hypothetical protein
MSNAVILSGFLPAQAFTGNPLDRHSDLLKRFQVTFNPDSEVSLIVVSGRDVVVRPIGPDSTPGVHQDLQALLLRTDDPELDLQGEELMLRWTPSEPQLHYPSTAAPYSSAAVLHACPKVAVLQACKVLDQQQTALFAPLGAWFW